ncbi:MAG: FkbM family methyltransferase [Betaproteobacteria bacterium]|nr:FkbM family methyltransferase [Betaproteobacteria bacterium]MBL8534607.1 FkbM family methyltransferase [Betaproteobacteria bacterium]
MNDQLIIDLGMNTAQDTRFYLRKGFRVVGVEANPMLAEEVSRQFVSEITAGRLVVENIGVGPQRGEFNFWVNHTHHEWSSFHEDIGSRGGAFHVIRVATVPLADLIQRHGVPHYLKVDIEGMDLTVLKALHDFSERPRYVSVETGPGLKWLDELDRLGYQRFKLIDQRLVPEQLPPDPAREGAYVPAVFEWGSTGLFGDELPGMWCSVDELRSQWMQVLESPGEGNPLWYDIHACRDQA